MVFYHKRYAFSLLELMIVLIIMIGVIAISWPNLTKKLNYSKKKTFEQKVKETIDKARYQSLRIGKSLLIVVNEPDIKVIHLEDIGGENIDGKKIWITPLTFINEGL
jgi:type II secretory pathway pseudopilin PulG